MFLRDKGRLSNLTPTLPTSVAQGGLLPVTSIQAMTTDIGSRRYPYFPSMAGEPAMRNDVSVRGEALWIKGIENASCYCVKSGARKVSESYKSSEFDRLRHEKGTLTPPS